MMAQLNLGAKTSCPTMNEASHFGVNPGGDVTFSGPVEQRAGSDSDCEISTGPNISQDLARYR